MSEKEKSNNSKKPIIKSNKIKPYLSRDDREMLREKNCNTNRKRRISDYHIDAA